MEEEAMTAVAVAVDGEHPAGATVTARYPSAQFPGPPGVAVDVPATWAPLVPAAYLRLGPSIDLAVAGPAEVDGVRPTVLVSVSRTLPTADPRTLLATVATTFARPDRADSDRADSDRAVPEGSFAPATEGGGHLSHAVGYDEEDGGRLVRRQRVTVYVHGESMAHVVSVVGSAAPADEMGCREVTAMLRSLRVVAPWAPAPARDAARDAAPDVAGSIR